MLLTSSELPRAKCHYLLTGNVSFVTPVVAPRNIWPIGSGSFRSHSFDRKQTFVGQLIEIDLVGAMPRVINQVSSGLSPAMCPTLTPTTTIHSYNSFKTSLVQQVLRTMFSLMKFICFVEVGFRN